jgi:hypothetical protein
MQIRLMSMFLFLMLLSTSGVSQQPSGPKQHIGTPEDRINSAITFGEWDGHMRKQFGKMGDAAAVTIAKVISERQLSAEEIEAVLAVLSSAFADPSLVDTPADREPRAAFFVLRYLDLLAQDANTKKKIADTRGYVQQQFAKYTAKISAGGTATPH